MKSARVALIVSTLSAAPAAFSATPPEKPAAPIVVGPAPSSIKSEIIAKVDAADLPALRAKAERGNAIAQYNLGLAYMQGRQTNADLVEAFVWLTLAADTGSTGKALETLV